MHPNEILIKRFYEAFQKMDYKTMQNAYHPDASFSDPVFQDLSVAEVKAMWQMLVTSATDLQISHSQVKADEQAGGCRWEARYTFTASGKKVHNVISTQIQFRDGKFWRQKDHFNFWRWSRMALGVPGLLLGWTSYFKNKVRAKARKRLQNFIDKSQPAGQEISGQLDGK